jgi:hypothetical protein
LSCKFHTGPRKINGRGKTSHPNGKVEAVCEWSTA